MSSASRSAKRQAKLLSAIPCFLSKPDFLPWERKYFMHGKNRCFFQSEQKSSNEDGPSNDGSANDAGAVGTNLCSALKKRFESCGAGLQVKTIKKLNLRRKKTFCRRWCTIGTKPLFWSWVDLTVTSSNSQIIQEVVKFTSRCQRHFRYNKHTLKLTRLDISWLCYRQSYLLSSIVFGNCSIDFVEKMFPLFCRSYPHPDLPVLIVFTSRWLIESKCFQMLICVN